MDSLSGSLLIATPDLVDPNFHRTVVLLLLHSEEGAMGIVLNRPTATTVSAVWDEISDAECECQHPVNWGGPMNGPLMALHDHPEYADEIVAKGVFFTQQRDALHALVMQSDFQFRIISNYSGWGPGQLEQEVEHGGWLTLPTTADSAFEAADLMWKKVCEHVGHEVLKPHIGMLKPTDPSLN